VTVRVLIADDQAVVRSGYRAIIDAQRDLCVVGEAADGAQAVTLARQLLPDVVVMDIRMPRMDGLAATRLLAGPRADPTIAVLVVTTFDLDEYVFGALRAGAAGFLLKDAEPEELIAAVRTISVGNGLVSPSVTRRLIAEFAALHPPRPADSRLAHLTAREAEVLRHIARGLTNADIAKALRIEDSTVKTHVARILSKLDLTNRAQAVVLAYESGVVAVGQP
jgi:DNA-binding NarL/FixJ family response regulator